MTEVLMQQPPAYDDPSRLIAVVGMAGRFPQAPSVEDFWDLLATGGDAIRPVPIERWDRTAQLDPERPIQDVGGFLDAVTRFDPAFFGISPREAEEIDPQQRLMLEVAWRTLEDAGQRAEGLHGSRTGVYVGASWHDYEILRKERGAPATQHSAVGNALDVIAARVSYFLRLRGPSLVVETGCSSSLVALDLARQALQSGEIEAALVGGVNLILAPDVSIGLTHFGGLSPDGRCMAFSSQANGFVRAECVAGLLLKRLDRAIADGDRIRAVVVASAVNNDGGGDSLVTPNPAGQEDLLRSTYTSLGIDPDLLSYVEAHGTGTGRGDPIEAGAVGRVLGQRRSAGAGPLRIGSVKTNIGHAEASAGLAGLIKAVLCLEHRVLPASLHADELNPGIDFGQLNLRVVRESTPLPDGPAYVGVNSFGWGGTNAHVVLSTAPAAGPEPGTTPVPAGSAHLVPVSAHSPAALAERCRDLAGALRVAEDVGGVLATVSHRRDHFPLRTAVVGADPASLVDTLERAADGVADGEQPNLLTGRARKPGRTAMVFPGQGGQWARMGASLYGTHPEFTDAIDRCAAALEPHVDWDLQAILSDAAETAWMSRVDVVQPVLWAVSVALAAAWEAAGITPDVVVGHSQGEVAAATVAGILSLEDAATVIARRSLLAVRAAGRGRMMAVALDADQSRVALAGFEDVVSLAVSNSPTSSVLSGDGDAVLTLMGLLEADDIFCRLVEVDYASHSPQMDLLLPDLLDALERIEPRPARIPLMSTVCVQALQGPEMGPSYWAENLRQPVMFHAAMERVLDDGITHVIEVSPHPVLASALDELAAARRDPPRVLSTLRRDSGSPIDLARAFGHAYVSGLEAFTARPPARPVAVPGYPWQRDTYVVSTQRRRSSPTSTNLTLAPSVFEPHAWVADLRLGLEDQPWLEDHKVHDAVVVPGAVMLSLALRTGRERLGRVPGLLRDVRFRSDLTLSDAPARLASMWRDDITEGGSWTLRSLSADVSSWTTHATARVHLAKRSHRPARLPGPDSRGEKVDVNEFYSACAARGLTYGEGFRGVQELWRNTREAQAVAKITLPQRCRAGARSMNPHPAVLDAALQVTLALQSEATTVVPVAIDEIQIHSALDTPLTAAWVLARRRDHDRHDIEVFAEDHQPVLTIHGLALEPITAAAAGEEVDAARLHHLGFLDQERSDGQLPVGRWVVCGDASGAGEVAAALGAQTLPLADVPDALQRDGITGLAYLAPTASDGLDAQRQGLADLVQLARFCAALVTPCRLAVVTTAAHPADGDEPDPGAGLFWGFARVLRREHGELRTVVVDVARAGQWAPDVAAELQSDADDDQVVLRPGRRLVGRVLVGGAPEPETATPVRANPNQTFALTPTRPGQWDGLEFRPVHVPPPVAGQVQVEVTATALNFIDVMKAMGTYPDPVGGELLGGECTGRVLAVGPGVTGVQSGDRVVACTFGAIASHITLDSRQVRRIPDNLSDAQAAALPLVMVTAWYALADRARLGAGETVLVHSAAGGLGLAAIAVARHLGAKVIATAGTEAKRDYLRRIGIDNVFDSRDLSWHDGVMEATGGRGADVVLNSLTGAAIDLGLSSLAEDGRFIEVGKQDIYSGRSLGLHSFRKRISLTAVDIAGLMDRRLPTFAHLLDQVWSLVADGSLPPLPVTTYPFSAAAEALRHMATGQHVGKLVLTDPTQVELIAPDPLPGGQLRPDGSYLITGGLGALGLSLAEFFVKHGAGALALLGRTRPGEAAERRISALRATGTTVRTYIVDVADHAALAEVLAAARTDLPPLRGVIHAAGLLEDATIATMSPDQLARVLAPKVDGARHLDTLTQTDPLDMFVLFSSAAALVGNPGQAAYAAGNAYLDGLASARRHRGQPALSVQWGPFDGVGLAAADLTRGNRLADRGMGGFPPAEAWEALTRLLRHPASVTAYVPLNIRQWFDAYPDLASTRSWEILREHHRDGRADPGGGSFLAQLHGCTGDDLDQLVENQVRALAGRVLRIDPDAIDRGIPFKSIGMDSLMSLEYRNRLEAAFNMTLSPTLLWTYGTPEALSGALSQRVRESARPDTGCPTSAATKEQR
jgi:phthiocerol/phenolphthiocerol synthesis type-I polyketide synthase C